MAKYHEHLQKLKESGVLEKISLSAKDLCEEKQLSLTALTIELSDAGVGYGVSFSSATCVTKESCREFYPFATIFKKGISTLSKVLNDFEYVPDKDDEKRILKMLLEFLVNQDCLDFIKTLHKKPLTNERQFTVALTEHMFSRLTEPGYVIDDHYDDVVMCNCGCRQLVSSKKSDTSIGHAAVWHGSLDLIVSDEDVPIKVHNSSPEGRTLLHVKDNMTEIDSVSTRQQIASQTIVFSFLQRKRHPDWNNILIPCIGVSFTEIIFFFYDCENDIFLKSLPMPILNEDRTINYQLIVSLWLVLNYKYFGTGLSERLQSAPKANFFNEAKDNLSVYRDNLSQGNMNQSVPPVRLDPCRHSKAKFVKYSEFSFPDFSQ